MDAFAAVHECYDPSLDGKWVASSPHIITTETAHDSTEIGLCDAMVRGASSQRKRILSTTMPKNGLDTQNDVPR
jgi:hypothetical protein